MTATYLTKRENDRLHFFRATVTDHGVDKVSGIFYEWIAKSWEGCGTMEQAKVRLEQRIAEKTSEGFRVTEYVEMPENTEIISRITNGYWVRVSLHSITYRTPGRISKSCAR